MGKKNDKVRKIKLTEHITYCIMENTIYLFIDDECDTEEFNVARKKISLIVDDNDISYINVSTKNMEKKKDFYRDFGFSLSYYDVKKLNMLFADKKDKKEYKCYGLMTRKDFFNNMEKKEDKVLPKYVSRTVNSNSGYISNLLLLFSGIIFLCYLFVQGAIYLVK